jgi:hypothetical protein
VFIGVSMRASCERSVLHCVIFLKNNLHSILPSVNLQIYRVLHPLEMLIEVEFVYVCL